MQRQVDIGTHISPHVCGSAGKESSCKAGDAGDTGLILVWEDPWNNGSPLQCSCLKNPKDRGAWRATVQRVAKSWTWLRDRAHTHACIHLCMHRISLEARKPGTAIHSRGENVGDWNQGTETNFSFYTLLQFLNFVLHVLQYKENNEEN